MRFAGIDIGGEHHAVAVVNEGGAVLVKLTFFGEEAAGYELGPGPAGRSRDHCLVAMEATGYGSFLRNRVKQLDQEIEHKLQDHEVGKLFTTIDGIGARTAACLMQSWATRADFGMPPHSQATSA